ncbi:MAG: Sir2 family NAD-dependent protein deacetylase, partial [Myxococcales bacterium]|nr:Sir2 family NAD-dependent protein deacetylase [Myxococcales bacterium]
STESGIPDFRGPGGVWSRYQPVLFQEFLNSQTARETYWSRKMEAYDAFAAARPNAGHRTLAALEGAGRLQLLITQNIDGLHELAGNSRERIVELHGTERWVSCLSCGERYPRGAIQERLLAGDLAPRCDACGGWLKPATISFGQSLDPAVLARAYAASRSARAFLVVGSSLTVHPAAGLPELAKRSGAWLGILNRDPTPLDELADWRAHGQAGAILERLGEHLGL